MRPRGRVTAFAALVLLLAAAVVPAAHALEPTKPSQIVTGLATTLGDTPSPPCAGVYQAIVVDRRANPDGTAEAFAIPPKHVLVVTSFEFSLSTTPSKYEQVSLAAIDLANPPTTSAAVPNLAFAGGVADSLGKLVVQSTLPGGFVVKPPAVLCVQGGATLSQAVIAVHGFFAKDK
jgi:hypothetical protein